MLASSAIVIKPRDSNTYVRLVLCLHLAWAALMVHLAIPWYIQLILLFFLGSNYVFYWSRTPCGDIVELCLLSDQCRLLMKEGQMRHYETLTIPIYNSLFGLIHLKGKEGNKVFVLFNDQLTSNELRLMHVKAWRS